MRNTNTQANSNASNLWKKYSGTLLAGTVVLAGIASAAVTPIGTLPNAVAGNVIKASDINDLASAVTILDQRTIPAVTRDSNGVIEGDIKVEGNSISTDKQLDISAYRSGDPAEEANEIGLYGTGIGYLWYQGEGGTYDDNRYMSEETLAVGGNGRFYAGWLNAGSVTAHTYLNITPYNSPKESTYGTGEARMWFNGIGSSSAAVPENTMVMDNNLKVRNGFLQVGNTSDTCDSLHAGAIRFSTHFEGCNGTAWVSLD